MFYNKVKQNQELRKEELEQLSKSWTDSISTSVSLIGMIIDWSKKIVDCIVCPFKAEAQLVELEKQK